MAELAKIHTDRLPDLKKLVSEGAEYNRKNVERYEKFMRFVFFSSLNDAEGSTLSANGMPNLQFNILESIISRKRGEFAKQQPDLTVRAADGVPSDMFNDQFSKTLDTVEQYLHAIFFDGSNDMLDYNIFSDLLAGGFSVMRVFTQYVNDMSFEQNIMVERVYDPTLTGFDPMARKSHKGDGRFCFELYPMTKDQIEEEFGKEIAEELKYLRGNGFDWSYQNDTQKVGLICDFYEKKTRKETIYKLANGHTLTKSEYTKLVEIWDQKGSVALPPAIINERKTNIEYICRYRFCESRVLDYKETNFKYLPLVFVDGNSVVLKNSGAYEQVTRPYVFHAEGIQRLKNYAGQSLANELENTVQHKYMVAIESVPKEAEYQSAYTNVQQAQVLMYNHFLDTNNPNVILPPPQPIARTPIPPEITNTFKMSDEMTQAILGSYDPAQAMNNAQMSGIAFARSAIQGDNATVPYIVGYIKGLNRVAQIVADLIPKYYKTPRSLPILTKDGKRTFKQINNPDNPDSVSMNYDPNMLQVKIEAGVNFAMQKEIALQTIIAMCQANQGFAQFFNDVGLPVLLDNIDIRGIDQLKEKATEWSANQKKEQEQQQQIQQQQTQQQAQQQAQASSLQMAEMKKKVESPTSQQVDLMKMQNQKQIDSANLELKQRDSDTKFLQIMSQIKDSDVQNQLKAAEIDAENTRSDIEAAVSVSKHINETIRSTDNGSNKSKSEE